MFENIGNSFKGLWKYALGRGLITTAVIASSFIASATGLSILFPIAIATGSAVWNVFTRNIAHRNYEKQMLGFYKDEVAAATGKEVGDVTVVDLRATAYGDEKLGIPRNEVLAYALDRQSAKSWLGLGTAILSAVVTFGLLQSPYLINAVEGVLSNVGFGGILSHFSTGVIAGTSSLLINNGLDNIIGDITRVHHLAAHDRILHIERSQLRGKTVDPVQVMDVFVAANPKLNDTLKAQYGERYQGMNRAEKITAIKALGVSSLMNKLAEGLSNGAIDATELAFISNGSEPLTRRGKATLATTKHEVAKIDTKEPEKHTSFAERVGGSRQTGQSFAERVEQSRTATTAHGVA